MASQSSRDVLTLELSTAVHVGRIAPCPCSGLESVAIFYRASVHDVNDNAYDERGKTEKKNSTLTNFIMCQHQPSKPHRLGQYILLQS